MKVTTVSASLRYRKALGDGSHKTVELSAEATLDQREIWQEAQGRLYIELGQQLKTLWIANGNGKADTEAQPSHYCSQHGVEFKRYEKNGRIWYAHKQGDGWCNKQQFNSAVAKV